MRSTCSTPKATCAAGTTAPQRIKGYNADEIVGRHFSIFLPPETAPPVWRSGLSLTAAREGKFEAQSWLVRKDGSRFYASVVIDAIRNDAGELVGFAKLIARHHRSSTRRKLALERRASSWRRRRRWKRSASSPAASPTTSTIC